MPHDDRPRFFKKIDCLIEEYTLLRRRPGARKYLRYLIALRAQMSQKRYLERPTVYRDCLYQLSDDDRLPKTNAQSKQMLRISLRELDMLVDLFGSNEAFLPKRGRRPASSRLQLAVCLYRLASGNTEATCETIFKLPSTSTAAISLNKLTIRR